MSNFWAGERGPSNAKFDVVYDNGDHMYWSTHCRHGNTSPPWDEPHKKCAATELAPGVPRKPAQCKTCAAPCRCECHSDRGDTRITWVPDDAVDHSDVIGTIPSGLIEEARADG